jgi:nitrogen-specific signal transduction histidine kinase
MPLHLGTKHHWVVIVLTLVVLGAAVLVISLQRRTVVAVERQSLAVLQNIGRQRAERLATDIRHVFDGAVLETLFAASAEMPSTQELEAVARQLEAGHRYTYVERFFFWNRLTNAIAPNEVLFFRRSSETALNDIKVRLGDGRTAGFYRSPERGRTLAGLARSFSRPDYRVTYAVMNRQFGDDNYQVVIRWWWTGEREQTFAVSGYLVNMGYVRQRLFVDLFRAGLPPELDLDGVSRDLVYVRDHAGDQVYGIAPRDGEVVAEEPLSMIFFPVTSRPARLVEKPSVPQWTLGVRVREAAVETPAISMSSGYWLSAGAVLLMLIALALAISANREAIKLAAIRADLVSSVTHELRTPLALLNLAGETMARARTQAPERLEEYIGVVRRESAQLMRLVDKTLELSRLESDSRAYCFEPTNVDELVDRVVTRFRDRLPDRDLNIRVEVGRQPRFGLIDARAFEQALINLLDNAVRHGATSRGIDVAVSTLDQLAAIDVVDYGEGIPPADLPHIFEKFFRGSNNGSARSGFGLGLALVSQVVDAHRGRIEVESLPGIRTRFRIILRRVTGGAHA